MRLVILVYLSKHWSDIIPRKFRKSHIELSEKVADHVGNLIASDPGIFPRVIQIAFSADSYSFFTPLSGSEPWQWWDKVQLECLFEMVQIDLNQIRDKLLGILPAETHIDIFLPDDTLD